MTEHLNALDYRNKCEREAAYWRGLWERYINAEEGGDAALIYDEAVIELTRIKAGEQR